MQQIYAKEFFLRVAIITKIIDGKKYLYEVKAFRKKGRIKHKWKIIGHYDSNGNFIASKRWHCRKIQEFPAEVQKVTVIKTKIKVVEKDLSSKESNK